MINTVNECHQYSIQTTFFIIYQTLKYFIQMTPQELKEWNTKDILLVIVIPL